MASRQWHLSIVLALVLGSILLLSTTAHAASLRGHKLIRTRRGLPGLSACKYTSYPALCVSSAKSLRRNKSPSLAAITRASILATISKTRQAKGMAHYYLGVKSKDPMRRANLNVCQQLYDDALDNLRKSMANLKTRSLADLKINLSAAMTDYTTCDDGFTENPGAKSPLAKVNGLLNKLTSNNLALATKIRH